MTISDPAALELCQSAAELQRRKRFPAAIACFQRAIALAPGDPILWTRLGHALWRDRRYKEAEDAIKNAIALDPENYENYHWLGSIYADTGRLDRAIEAYDVALTLNPRSDAVRLDRGLTHLLHGNLSAGFRGYEARIEHLKSNYPDMPMPRWNGQDAMGKTILVVAEQGLGDIIMFSRYLPWLAARCEKLIFHGPKELACLFESWPKHVVSWYRTAPLHQAVADFYIPLGSLPLAHGTSTGTIPPDPGFFGAVLPKPTHSPMQVGICWAGNPQHGRDRDRSIALEHFLPLSADPKIQLYSFQVGQRAGDIDMVGAQKLVIQQELPDWKATKFRLYAMDAVVSVDSAVAHLAAAIGVPTMILLAQSPDWRWGIKGKTTPWYPTVRLYRQGEADWGYVFEEIASDIWF